MKLAELEITNTRSGVLDDNPFSLAGDAARSR